MPRINLDDKFFSDKRFDYLGKLLQIGRHEARSKMLDVWHRATFDLEDAFLAEELDIIFELEGASSALVKSKLAEECGDKVRVKGVEKRIAWLKSAQELGRKSASVRREKYGTAQPKTPKNIEGRSKVPSEGLEGSSNALRTSSSSSSSSSNSNTKESPAPTHPLFEIWNEHRGKLPKSLLMTPKRLKNANARLKEVPDLEQWVKIVKKLASSEWHLGKNDRGWRADFDFFLKPDTYVKAMEGQYDNKSLSVPTIRAVDFS